MDIDLLLMVEKGIKGGICHAFNSSLYKYIKGTGM